MRDRWQIEEYLCPLLTSEVRPLRDRREDTNPLSARSIQLRVHGDACVLLRSPSGMQGNNPGATRLPLESIVLQTAWDLILEVWYMKMRRRSRAGEQPLTLTKEIFR